MKLSKKQLELSEKLSKYNLLPNQLQPILKSFAETKDDVSSIDAAQRFKDINEGKKIRDFYFTYLNGCHKKRGVYKLSFFGSKKFYIGRSKYIETRFKQHYKEIHNFFTTGKYPPEHYFRKVFEHLTENQWAYYFEVQLLEECYSVDELVIKEQKWLNKYKYNPNCLNVGFIAKKPAREIDETPEEQWERKANTGIARRGGRLIFYPKKKIETDVLDKRVASVLKHTTHQKTEANSFSLNVPELLSEKGHTVFKLFYGDIYIIHKGKTLSGSLFLLQKGLGYYLAYDHAKESKFDKDYYFKFYDFIRRNPDRQFCVEIILESEDPYEILVCEQQELNNSLKDKKCYNNNIKGYVPTLNPKTGLHGWITPEQVERFYTFLAAM